jgi:peptidoglycan/LPS O-acetylase OafA/YrhL
VTKNPRVPFGLWLVSAVLSALLGLLMVTHSGVAAFYRGYGVLLILASIAVGMIAGRVQRGDVRLQRAAVALSLVFGLVQIASVFVGAPVLLLITALLLLGAALITYRTHADEWFT